MKEPKPLRPQLAEQSLPPEGSTQGNHMGREWPEQKPPPDNLPEQKPPRAVPMHAEAQNRKARGRLGRDVQSKLGKTLQAYFDDVVKEGVPDRFKDLLSQLEVRKDKESS